MNYSDYEDYYAYVSSTIESDELFKEIITNCWMTQPTPIKYLANYKEMNVSKNAPYGVTFREKAETKSTPNIK